MGDGSRGVKSRQRRAAKRLSEEEITQLLDATSEETSPIAQAILGAVLVEHDLDAALRQRLGINDDGVWDVLLDGDRGPFSTFDRKILMGHALSLYDSNIRDNLNVVKRIRNHFAHSSKIIDFSTPDILSEFQKIKIPAKHKRGFQTCTRMSPSGEKYVTLCFVLSNFLFTRILSNLKVRNRRSRKKTQSAFYRTLAPALGLGSKPWTSLSDLGLLGRLPPPPQTDDPNAEALPGLLSPYLAELAKRGGNTDK